MLRHEAVADEGEGEHTCSSQTGMGKVGQQEGQGDAWSKQRLMQHIFFFRFFCTI